jgi:hypothetical protein
MGFTVNESVSIPKLGISVQNCYVTIKAFLYHFPSTNMPVMMGRIENPGPYNIYSSWYIYSSNDKTLSPLQESKIVVRLDVAPTTNMFDIVYTAIKANNFAGLTCTDVLADPPPAPVNPPVNPPVL